MYQKNTFYLWFHVNVEVWFLYIFIGLSTWVYTYNFNSIALRGSKEIDIDRRTTKWSNKEFVLSF